MTDQEFIQNIRNLIAKDDLTTAIIGLKELLDNTPLLNEVLHQSGRFENIQKQIRLGTLNHTDADLTLGQIRTGLLELVSEIETNIGNQTKTKTQYITYNGTREIPTILTLPGADVPESFLGRVEEREKIRTLLTTRQRPLALVNAEGGMGKTTLAAYYWEGFSKEYKHMAWLFCENGIISAMLSQLPQPLGIVDNMAAALQQAAATNTPNEEALWQTLKNEIARLDQPCLLVLDNANDAEEIRRFLQKVKGLNWHILLTSRCSKVMPDADSEYAIEGLPPDLAKELFKRNHDEATPDFEILLDRFLTAVGYNTLCIEVFSKNLAEGRDWGQNLRGLLDKLETTGLILGTDSFEVRAEWTDNTQRPSTHTTDDIIAALYNLADLEQSAPPLHALLSTLALLPAEKHPATVLGTLLPAENPAALKKQLDQLVRKGWLSQAEGAYRLSPVVQKIVLQATTPQQRWQWAEPMVQRLQKVFDAEGTYTKNIVTATLFAELVFGLADNIGIANDEMATLFRQLWIFYYTTGNIPQALMSAEKRRDISRQYDSKRHLAGSYDLLGRTHSDMGNLPQALAFFEEMSKLFKELHEAYPQNVNFKDGLAVSYEKLGSTHTSLGNLLQALTFFEQYNHLEKELHETYLTNVDFKENLAISYQYLGLTHTALGNLPQALTFFEQYNQLEAALHEANPQNVSFKNGLAISCCYLGSTHTALGNLPKALTFFEQYNQLEKELQEAFPTTVDFKNNLAISYQYLASTHTALGNLPQALTFFEQDYQLEKELHEAYPQNVNFKNGLAISYDKLGSTHTALGNLPQALTFFENYNQLEKELHDAYPQNVGFKSNYAESLSVLFAIKRLMNRFPDDADIDSAISHFESLFSSIQTPHYQQKLALCQQMKVADPGELKHLIAEISAF